MLAGQRAAVGGHEPGRVQDELAVPVRPVLVDEREVGLALGAAPLAVISIGVGVAFSFIMVRGRGHGQARQAFAGWLREQIMSAQTRLTSEFSRHLIDVSEEMRNVITARVEVQQQEIAAGLAAMRRAQEDDAATRRRKAQAGLLLWVAAAQL